MRASARELISVCFSLPHVSRLTLASLVFAFFLFTTTTPIHAQETATVSTSTSAAPLTEFFTPRTDDNVPRNLSTLAQSVTLEVLATVVCQIAGIDPINPKQTCLGVNPITGQLGYSPTNPESDIPVGGLLGVTPDLFRTLFTPTTSTAEYGRYISQGFGLVKTAHAQNSNDGFTSLQPILRLWTAVRNLAYMFLILAFIFIGLGVMLRVKIDPRTVMSVQNQIPRIVICIMLITFSYAIGAMMIDAMWLGTYAGINVLTMQGGNPQVGLEGKNYPLSELATKNILQTPLAYINAVQSTEHNAYGHITDAVSKGVSLMIRDIVEEMFNAGGQQECDLNPIGGTNLKACVGNIFGFVIGGAVRVLAMLIILVTLLVVLFRIWFMLLKAYVMVLLYIIAGPIWIVFGLLPGRPLGFEKWMRALFASVAVFPLVVFLFVGGRVLAELFRTNPSNKFVAPLTGNPNMPDFGVLIAFGLLLMGPRIHTMLKESMKATGNKNFGAIAAGLAAGAAAPAALANNRWQHLTKRNPTTGEGQGMLAHWSDVAGKKGLTFATKIPGVGTLAKDKLGSKLVRFNKGRYGDKEERKKAASDYLAGEQARKQEKKQAHPSRWRQRKQALADTLQHGKTTVVGGIQKGKETVGRGIQKGKEKTHEGVDTLASRWQQRGLGGQPPTPPPPTTPPTPPKGGPGGPEQGGGGVRPPTPPSGPKPAGGGAQAVPPTEQERPVGSVPPSTHPGQNRTEQHPEGSHQTAQTASPHKEEGPTTHGAHLPETQGHHPQGGERPVGETGKEEAGKTEQPRQLGELQVGTLKAGKIESSGGTPGIPGSLPHENHAWGEKLREAGLGEYSGAKHLSEISDPEVRRELGELLRKFLSENMGHGTDDH